MKYISAFYLKFLIFGGKFLNLYLCFLETTTTLDHYVSAAVEKGKREI